MPSERTVSRRRAPTTTYPEPRPPPAGAGLALMGPEGRWIAVEDELCKAVGRGEAELAQSLVDALVHPQDRTEEEARHRQLLSGALEAYRARVQLVAGDGQPAWGIVDGRAALDAEGRPAGVALLVTDASARRRLELGGMG